MPSSPKILSPAQVAKPYRGTPVRRLKNGDVRIDCLAVAKALKAGALRSKDRKIIESMLPGLCDQLTTRSS